MSLNQGGNTVSLEIYDFSGKHEADSFEDIEALFSSRYQESSNLYYCSANGVEYPMLQVMVKGDQAALLFFPKDRHPGFLSQGNQSGGETEFFENKEGAKLNLANESVIPIDDALAATKCFLGKPDIRPEGIEWAEL